MERLLVAGDVAMIDDWRWLVFLIAGTVWMVWRLTAQRRGKEPLSLGGKIIAIGFLAAVVWDFFTILVDAL